MLKHTQFGYIIIQYNSKIYHPILCTFTKEDAKELVKENKWKKAKIKPCKITFEL